MSRFRKFFSLAAGAGCLAMTGWVPGARAQEPLAPAAPLSPGLVAPATAATVVTAGAAQRAQDLGLPALAADIYRQLLGMAGADRVQLSLALATALLDAGDAAEAEKVLASVPEPHDAAWRLRAGLASLQLEQRAAAQAQWDAINEAEISAADMPWYRFFTGALWDTATPRDTTRANQFYRQAEELASTPLARARFQLAGERVRLDHVGGKPSPADLQQARDIAQSFAGLSIGYEAWKNYAVMLAKDGQQKEAVASLERALAGVPAQERGARDELRFLLGLIGERGLNGAGRNALIQLLESGQNSQRQRQAAQLLFEASRGEPARGQFKGELGKLIEAKPPHPILESLYYFRAQLALAEKDYVRAEADAAALGKQFPLSPLRAHALVILAQSAWEQGRYRVAADNARKARAEMDSPGQSPAPAAAVVSLPKPPVLGFSPKFRAELGVLEAEARFRATDYRSAADAYAAVLLEQPRVLDPGRIGELMFQRVLAEIKSESGEAAKVLDQLERDPAFDTESRWQAEWSLARALQVQGQAGSREAYARVTALLRESAATAGGLRQDLYAKMAWLHARLSFDIGEPTETLRLIEQQLKTPLGTNPALRDEIASTLMLLKARSEFALGREPAALESLKRLRAEYAKSDAALYSYLIQAEYYAAQDKIDEARNQLIKLTDNDDYKHSPYVPYALYRLALLSERLGREENLIEANQRIEDLVKTPAAAADQTLLFAARMRQGDIFRKRNDFPAAKAAYEDLINRYPQRPDIVLAQLALADCYSVQSSPENPSSPNAASDAAQLIYEQLRDRVNAPRDVQVEAGYKLGALLARRGRLDEAAKVWWSDVIDPFLKKEAKPAEPGAKRPYWLARTLCELGDLQEKRGRREEAKAAYQLVLEKRLPFEAMAKSRLQQLGVPVERAGQ